MHILIPILLWLAPPQIVQQAIVNTPAAGGGAIKTAVQGTSNNVCCGAQTTITLTFGTTIGAGHMLLTCVSSNVTLSGATIFGDADTYITDPNMGNVEWDTADPFFVTCAYVTSTVGGGTTLAWTVPSAFEVGATAVEMSGVTSFDKSDTGSAQNSIGGATISSLAVTPTASNSLLIGVAASGFTSASNVFTAGTNVAWSLVPNSASGLTFAPGMGLESFFQATPASTSAQFTQSRTGYYWFGHIVVFH